MIWALLSVVSAALLGIYDIFKKLSLRDNAVIPTLLISNIFSALVFIPFLILSQFNGSQQWLGNLYVPVIPLYVHGLLIIKSIIVGSSWIFAYFALKHLPVTIASPIRSSGPLWTLAGAILLFGEQLNILQWIGLSITLLFYYLFSFSGLKEGISFRTNKWVLFMVISTMIGSVSALYDKYLITFIDRMAIQAWYMLYMIPIMFSVFITMWYPKRAQLAPFEWRKTIPLIGITLAVADFIYFKALSTEGALIAIVSTIRRSSVIVSFALGAILFNEKNIKTKALLLIGILVGIILIVLGGH